MPAKWRLLVKSGRLELRPRLGTGELWLAVLEPGTESVGLLRSLHAEPDEVRAVVLHAMTPKSRPVPTWPSVVPQGVVSRLIGRLLGHGD